MPNRNMSANFTMLRPRRPDVNGSDEQTWKRDDQVDYLLNGIQHGSVTALLSSSASGTAQYLFNPQVHRDLEGKPKEIVGNVSNVQGEFSMVTVSISALGSLFPIIDEDAKVDQSWGASHCLEPMTLTNTKWRGKDNMKGALYTCFLPIYEGMEPIYGSLDNDDFQVKLKEKFGPGYETWALKVEHYGAKSDTIFTVTSELDDEDKKKYFSDRFTQPGRCWSEHGP